MYDLLPYNGFRTSKVNSGPFLMKSSKGPELVIKICCHLLLRYIEIHSGLCCC